jgi:hypothetical protein
VLPDGIFMIASSIADTYCQNSTFESYDCSYFSRRS